MYGIIIAGLMAIGMLSYSAYVALTKTESAVEAAKEAKTLLNVQKKMAIRSNTTKQTVKNATQLKNVKLSELAVGETQQDRKLLNKLQLATEDAIINKHIPDPTCEELAGTGKITLEECQYIANKKQNYAEVSNLGIKIDMVSNKDKQVVGSLNALTNNGAKIEDGQVANVESKVNTLKQKTIEIQKSEKIINKAVKIAQTTKDPEILTKVTEKVVKLAPVVPGKVVSAVKTIEYIPIQQIAEATTALNKTDALADNYETVYNETMDKVEDLQNIKETITDVTSQVEDYKDILQTVNEDEIITSDTNLSVMDDKDAISDNEVIEELQDNFTNFKF